MPGCCRLPRSAAQHLEKTVIAEGSIINASRIENSVIGIRSRIGHGTTIVSCYIMGNDYYETLEEIDKQYRQRYSKDRYRRPLLYQECDR